MLVKGKRIGYGYFISTCPGTLFLIKLILEPVAGKYSLAKLMAETI